MVVPNKCQLNGNTKTDTQVCIPAGGTKTCLYPSSHLSVRKSSSGSLSSPPGWECLEVKGGVLFLLQPWGLSLAFGASFVLSQYVLGQHWEISKYSSSLFTECRVASSHCAFCRSCLFMSVSLQKVGLAHGCAACRLDRSQDH
ncbi:hypothetical protein HJG60_011710 [Phyllostomus discolor]|uniref:Uncharacterized protein n=1 Tax=Phyllostomus discolor TaxID=89673 RepID=A0A834E124_9CHIR|nr:hypothetical protein HJG60_011710 [Phyllostomus discolor]